MNNLRVIANQLDLAGGLRRDKGECLIDSEMWMPPPALQKRGRLYIITEIEREGREVAQPTDLEYCQEAQATILEEYYNFNASASITSALRHAFERANQQIFNRNSATLPLNRRGVGVTCVVVRGTELFLAQMPPTQAFVTHQGQLRFVPLPNYSRPVTNNQTIDIQFTESIPLAGNRRSDAPPSLGRYVTIEPNFSRSIFEDGDLFVLASTELIKDLSEDQAERYFLNNESRAALYNLADYARSNGINNGYAMSVGVKSDFSTERLSQVAAQRAEVLTGNPRLPEPNPLRDAVEGVAASASLLVSKILPTRERERAEPQRPETFTFEANRAPEATAQPNPPANQDEDEKYLEELLSANRQAQPVTPQAIYSTIDPLPNPEPAQDSWIKREADSLKTPPFLRSRMPDAAAEPSTPAPDFSRQQAGAFHIPKAEEITPAQPQAPPAAEPKPGQRYFAYTGPEMGGEPHTPPPPPPRFIHSAATQVEEAEVAWGTPPAEAKKSRFNFGNRKKAATKLDPGQANPDPYFDMVGVDGYGPALDQIKDERKLLGGRFRFDGVWVKVALLVLIVAAILFIVSATFNIGGGLGSNKALDYVRAAEQKRASAQQLATSDPVRARLLITQASADLDAATKEKKDLPEITTVRNALKITLDNVDRVVIPPDLRLSVDLSAQGAGMKLVRAVLSPTGDAVFLMDSGRSQILLLDLQGTVKTILKAGDSAGGKTFSKPVVMAARVDSIIVIDSANVAWIYDKGRGTWLASQLGGSEGWPNPVRLADTYQGNLYVVGPAGGQILRYVAGAYGNKPDEWLEQSQVETAGMNKIAALAIDGNIYNLTTSGAFSQMARTGGKNKGEVINQYDLNGNGAVSPAINKPLALSVGSIDFPYIFVVDTEKRVLQFQKSDGVFIQQFKAAPGGKEFDDIRDLLLDEVNRKLYIVSDQRIYVFRIPTAPPLSPVAVSSTPAVITSPVTSQPITSPRPTSR